MDFAPKPPRREVLGDERARPPTALTSLREAVAIPIGADEFWWCVRERIMREQANNSFFPFAEPLNQRKNPRVKLESRHSSEPHLPFQLPMIRRHDARRAVHVSWF